MTRAESAAATRRALLDDAAELLDAGGPDAVTLREVGARAGVSRGAPYRHFENKDSLLIALAAEGWERLARQISALQSNPRRQPRDTLRAALLDILSVSRHQPYLYQLMFNTPSGDTTAVVDAAQRLCDEFLAIVAAVGDDDPERLAATLLTAVHGAAGLETSGLLNTEKWHTTADALIDSFIDIAIRGDRQH